MRQQGKSPGKEPSDAEPDIGALAELYREQVQAWLMPEGVVHVPLGALEHETRCPICYSEWTSAQESTVI
jgi:hypothetical protein